METPDMSATKVRQIVLAARPQGKPRLSDFRLEETAIPTPGPGQVLLRVQHVAAASGPVGSLVGQLATIAGARAVGIAGGPEKCAYVKDELGFDAVVDHKATDFSTQLATACPKGIDVYFGNVG